MTEASELTLIECQDRLNVLKEQAETKKNEISSFQSDISNLAAQSPDSSLPTEQRIKFSEDKAKTLTRIKSAISLAEGDLRGIQSGIVKVEAAKARLEARDEFLPAMEDFNKGYTLMMSAWDRLVEASHQSPICEPNFPHNQTLDEVVKVRGMFAIAEDDGKFKLI